MKTNIPFSTKPFPNNLKRWILIFFVALTPAIVSFSLITFQGYHLADFLPNFSDEVSYWNQINTFRAVGLNGGYFTINELAPPAEFTHFYTYGPWHPALYGTLARIIGWGPTTILLINTLLLGLALIIFCVTSRLSEQQMLITILTLATMWGLILFTLTAMQEAYQQTLAILLASVFVIALREGEKTSVRVKITGILLIVFAAVMRLSWVILFLPFMVLTGKKTVIHWLGYIIAFAIVTLSVMLFANYTGAPGNNSVFDILESFRISFGVGLSYLMRYLIHSLGRFFFLPKPGTDVLQTYQVVVFIIGLIAFIVQKLIHRGKKPTLFFESIFHLYNLGVTVLAACALYIIGSGGDYRLLACHLLVTLLVMIALKRYKPVFLIIVTNVLGVVVFLGVFQTTILSKYQPDHSAYTAFKEVADQYIVYDPQATNSWCNTLLFFVGDYSNPMLDATPAGIGISFFKDPKIPIMTFKSRYLLLNDENFRLINQRADAPDLVKLADIPVGILYLNQSADCANSSTS